MSTPTMSTIKKVSYTIKRRSLLDIIIFIKNEVQQHTVPFRASCIYMALSTSSLALFDPSYYLFCFVFSRVCNVIMISSGIFSNVILHCCLS